jgi:hypothetical protein
MIGYIYVLKDPLSSEVRYVGKTSNPEDRIKRHLSEYSLTDSWTNKNKWILWLKDNGLKPIMEVVEECDFFQINEFEKKWILFYKNKGSHLTNMTDGGDGFDWTGRKHKNESIEKMKMNHPFRKDIIQFDLQNNIIDIFSSSYEASEKTGILRANICRSCRGKCLQIKGYYFRYIDNYFSCSKSVGVVNEEHLRQRIQDFLSQRKKVISRKEEIKNKIKETKKLRGKKIIKYDLNGNNLDIFDSLKDACEKTGYHPQSIKNCCDKKKYYTTHGFTFRYGSDEFDYIPYNKNIQKKSRKICKYDLEGNLSEVYDSIKDAVRKNNISSDSNIVSCCNRKINKKTGKFIVVKGFTYRYFSETSGDKLN